MEKLVKRVSYSLARKMCGEKRHKIRGGYYYVFQALLGELPKFMIIFLFGLCVNMFFESLLIVLTFCTFRLLTGGYHAENYIKCFIITIIIFSISIITAKLFIILNINNFLLEILMSYIVIMHVIYSPQLVNEKSDSRNFYIKIISVTLVFVIYIITYYTSINVRVSLLVGMLAQGIAITRSGRIILKFINNIL